MAEFYETLAQYYDELFPAEETTVDFLDDRFRSGVTTARPQILDLACGTGAYTSALSQRGYHCYGVDADPAMIARARAARSGRFAVRRMEEIADLRAEGGGFFDGAFCIGNSLPHLPGRGAVRSVLSSLRGIVRPRASLVIQTVNFPRFAGIGAGAATDIGSRTAVELPSIERPTVTMERRYRPMPGDPERVRFEIRLRPKDGPGIENAVSLLALTPDFLAAELPEAGFRVTEVAGDFDDSPYDPESSFVAVTSAVAE